MPGGHQAHSVETTHMRLSMSHQCAATELMSTGGETSSYRNGLNRFPKAQQAAYWTNASAPLTRVYSLSICAFHRPNRFPFNHLSTLGTSDTTSPKAGSTGGTWRFTWTGQRLPWVVPQEEPCLSTTSRKNLISYLPYLMLQSLPKEQRKAKNWSSKITARIGFTQSLRAWSKEGAWSL